MKLVRTPPNIRGLSLIELLVALAIAALLLLGLSQIFIGSKNAYRLQDGMSRTQENARFVLQYLENNVRMAGYMGCGNDVTLAGDNSKFINHLGTRTSAQGAALVQTFDSIAKNFARPIEGYAYTTPTDTNGQPLTPGGTWTPPLPPATDAGANITSPANGSDILILRIISADSIAMSGNLDIVNGTFGVASSGFVTADTSKYYALTACENTQIFNASAVTGTTVTALGSVNALRMVTGGTTWTGTYANQYFAQGTSVLSGEVHRAEYLPIYVGFRANTTPANSIPVLKVGSDEVADNVEFMRVWYGIDSDGDGTADAYVTADNVAAVGADQAATDAAWRRVLSVRIGLLMRSEDSASTSPRNDPGTTNGANNFRLFTDTFQRPVDGKFRDVYTTTIALRNRLVNY